MKKEKKKPNPPINAKQTFLCHFLSLGDSEVAPYRVAWGVGERTGVRGRARLGCSVL